MKNLKLLNNKFIITIFTIFISISANLYAEEEAKDIWSLNNEGENQIKKDENNASSSEINILD